MNNVTLHGGKSQLDELKEYIEDNFISFETLLQGKTMDELTGWTLNGL